MALAQKLSTQFENFKKNAPSQIKDPVLASRENFIASYQISSAAKVGDTFPSFRLTNAVGKEVTRDELLAQGPLLITFYRGEWCPFCNMALIALQERVDYFKAKGVTLVAISPELPNSNLSTTEKHALKFQVLSDVGNKLAKELGILFAMPDSVRPAFDIMGHDLKGRNGDDSFELPLPATFLVDAKGIVRNSYVNPDYTKRIEPDTAMEWVDALQK